MCKITQISCIWVIEADWAIDNPQKVTFWKPLLSINLHKISNADSKHL